MRQSLWYRIFNAQYGEEGGNYVLGAALDLFDRGILNTQGRVVD